MFTSQNTTIEQYKTIEYKVEVVVVVVMVFY